MNKISFFATALLAILGTVHLAYAEPVQISCLAPEKPSGVVWAGDFFLDEAANSVYIETTADTAVDADGFQSVVWHPKFISWQYVRDNGIVHHFYLRRDTLLLSQSNYFPADLLDSDEVVKTHKLQCVRPL